MIKKIFHIIYRSFNLRSNAPEDKEMEDLMKSIINLEFDSVSKGKENIRGDIYRFGSDFKKSVFEAKEKLEKEGCLS